MAFDIKYHGSLQNENQENNSILLKQLSNKRKNNETGEFSAETTVKSKSLNYNINNGFNTFFIYGTACIIFMTIIYLIIMFSQTTAEKGIKHFNTTQMFKNTIQYFDKLFQNKTKCLKE
jgi:hypothetical protein